MTFKSLFEARPGARKSHDSALGSIYRLQITKLASALACQVQDLLHRTSDGGHGEDGGEDDVRKKVEHDTRYPCTLKIKHRVSPH